jgi:pimeloyl-ACP methyl ester carboxylesterase
MRPFASEDEAMQELMPIAMGDARVTRGLVAHNLRREGSSWVWKPDMQGLAGGVQRSMSDPRRWTMWGDVRSPALILRGARSMAVPPAAAEAMVAQKANATLVTVPDAGHFVALAQPEAFVHAVSDWLGISPLPS